MAIKIACMNQKGGVGKSSLIYILADFLSNYGKVLVLDLDQQNNQKTILGVRSKIDKSNSAAGVLLNNINPSLIATKVKDNIDLISSGGKVLENFNVTYKNVEENNTILKKKMKDVEEKYDYVLIDSNPTMNLIHANIACYADFVILPCDMELMCLSSTRSMIHFFQSFRERTNDDVAEILGVVPIKFDQRRNLDNMVLEDLHSMQENDLLGGGIVFKELRESSNIKTAQAKRKFLSETFPSGKLTNDCYKLVVEVAQRIRHLKANVSHVNHEQASIEVNSPAQL